MIVTIHQPEYLPWLGFFDRIDKSNIFVILDNVQFQKGGFINRNKINTATGWQWLTIPVKEKSSHQKIAETKINNEFDWRESHWRALNCNYSRASYFKKYADFFEKVYTQNWDLLVDLDIFLIKKIMEILQLRTQIVIASALNAEGKATELLINICKTLGGNTYLSGQGGKRYMDMKRFEEEGIKVLFQEFNHPKYPQVFEKKAGFVPNLSIVDLLFNCGEKSLNIIRGKTL